MSRPSRLMGWSLQASFSIGAGMKLYWSVLVLAVSLSSSVQAGSFREALKDIGNSAQQNLEKGSGGVAAVAQVSSGAAQEATWRDPKTGLTWRLCALGTKWREGASPMDQCTDKDGRQRDYTWWDAALAVKQLNINEYSDWRLPTLKELAQIHEGCDSTRYVKEDYGWEKYKTDKGEVAVLTSCLKGRLQAPGFSSGNTPLYKKKSDYTESDSSLWTSSMVAGQEFGPKNVPWQYNNDNILRSASAIASSQENDKATVLVVRGAPNTDFDRLLLAAIVKRDAYQKEMVGRDAAYDVQAKKESAYRQAEDTRNRATLEKRKKDLEQRRNSLKTGERVTVSLPGSIKPYQGLVLEIKSNLVRVQIMNPIQEIWVKRDQLYF